MVILRKMASLVIVQKKKEAARRQRVAEMKRDHKRFVDEILGRWGHDGKKELEFDSLKAWLTSVNKGVEPSDDETKWVMAMANQGHTENGTTFASMERKSVLADDLEKALSAWMSYKDSCPEIEEVFKKFDPNGDKILDRAELALLLTDLNQGQEPAESEVDWVLKEADVIGQGAISKPCLAKAVSLWYTMVEDVDHPARDNSRKSLGKESLGTSAREVGGTPLPETQKAVAPSVFCGSKACTLQ